jgi:DNA-binding CsgD family transcriptional regulator
MVQGRKPDLVRRRQVARLHGAGYSVPQIARRLGLTYPKIQIALKSLRRGTVACSVCEAIFSAPQGSLQVRGVLCRECLANSPQVSFWRHMLSLRLMAGLTQAELAYKTGLSPSAVYTLERGLCQPRPRTRYRLLAFLDSTLARRLKK